jgi:glyceraldehyde 3-phosphate dehydrogenase
MKKLAINGFGRIGRSALRIALKQSNVEVVAINDPSPPEQTAHLFQFDTNFGRFEGEVELQDGGKTLVVDGHKIKLFSTRNIPELPWGDLGVDTVLECTGVFRTTE